MSASRRWHTGTSGNKSVGSGKKKLGGNRKKYKQDLEEKVLELNSGKRNQNKGKLFKVTCNKCGKCGHRASDCWGNENKVNENKNNRKPCFNGAFNNRGKKSHRAVDCWSNNKQKEDNFKNLFVGAKLCGEVLENENE